MGVDPSEDPKQIAKGYISEWYAEPPDLVLNADTDFPAALPGALSAVAPDPVPIPPDPERAWRENVKEWFDRQP